MRTAKTVKEVSNLTGVSIRTLHHYDSIGLLKPTEMTEAGYRLYDDGALERLQMILLFRELQFPLKEIKTILDSPGFDCGKALEQQIKLLQMRREHLNDLIDLARRIKQEGDGDMDFEPFNTEKIKEYEAEARKSWGHTASYREYEKKAKGRTMEEQGKLNQELMGIFKEFGDLHAAKPELQPGDEAVQRLIAKLQQFITEKFYTCTPDIFRSLGQMYAAEGSMKENIDKAGGLGTADFAAQAIEVFCSK
ncbi:MAG: MerR family transcriptional regulator [Bacillota bacterium]|nr:MerR family transcriptional regulator [Bacillota bacterium]